MTKISTLPADSAPSSDDYIVVNDSTSGQTKKVLLSDLLSYINTSGTPKTTNITNAYKFLAYANAVQNISGSVQKLAFNTEAYDTGGNYDNATNYRFTAPVAGFYFFYAQDYIQTLTGAGIIALYKNGSLIADGLAYSNANDCAIPVTATLQLSANDYIEVFINNTQGTRNHYGAAGGYYTYFMGFLVSAS